jgi:hypothetical protein
MEPVKVLIPGTQYRIHRKGTSHDKDKLGKFKKYGPHGVLSPVFHELNISDPKKTKRYNVSADIVMPTSLHEFYVSGKTKLLNKISDKKGIPTGLIDSFVSKKAGSRNLTRRRKPNRL